MKLMKQKKPGKLLSLLLALVMVVGMFPLSSAFAAGPDKPQDIKNATDYYNYVVNSGGKFSVRLANDIDISKLAEKFRRVDLTGDSTIDLNGYTLNTGNAVSSDGYGLLMFYNMPTTSHHTITLKNGKIHSTHTKHSEHTYAVELAGGVSLVLDRVDFVGYAENSTNGHHAIRMFGSKSEPAPIVTIRGCSFNANFDSMFKIENSGLSAQPKICIESMNSKASRIVGSFDSCSYTLKDILAPGSVVFPARLNVSRPITEFDTHPKTVAETNIKGGFSVVSYLINAVNIGITSPVLNSQLVDATAKSNEPDKYEVSKLTWYKNGKTITNLEGKKFENGESYMATVELTAKGGYIFNGSSTSAVVNADEDDRIAKKTVNEHKDNKKITVEIQFKTVSDNLTPISRINLSTDGYQLHGKVSDAKVLTDSYNVTVTKTRWRDAQAGKDLKPDDTFEAGKKYSVILYVSAADGYKFRDSVNTVAYMGKNKFTVSNVTDETAVLQGDLPKLEAPISTVSVTVAMPVAGETAPKNIAATVPSDANYTAKLIFWIDNASGETVDTFESGHSYYARVEVTPKPGYELAAKPDVTVNGTKATSSTLGCFDSSVFDVNAEEIEITQANVTLENFKVGNKISDVILTCEHPEQYVASNLRVRTGIGETPLADNAVLEDRTYLVEVKITPKDGYIISSSTNSHITNGDGFEGGTDPSMPWKYVTPEKDTPSHTHTATLVSGQAATCTADGWKDYYKCDCGKFFEDAACTAEISDLDAWKNAEGKLAKLEHTLGEWQHDDTDHWKKCSVCGTIAEQAAHTFGEWTIVTPATETADGLRKHTCSVCGHEATEVIPAEGHTHVGTLVTGQAATCTADGWKDYYKCDCGKFFEDAACATEISDLDAWKNGEGKLAKLEHTFGEWQHDDANHWKKCSVCGTIAEQAAHTFGEWTIVTPATETADGLRKHTCSVCGHEATQVIPAEGHTHVGTLVAGQAPTHNADGWKDYYKCSCGKFFEDAACTKEIPNLAAWQNGAGKLDKLVYIVIEGNNSSWQKNTDGTITFRVNGDFADFTGIKVDGTVVASKHYTAKSGSTIVTLNKAYLQSLSEGSHTITFLYTDGQCEAKFNVTAAATPSEPTAPETTEPTNPTKPNPPTGVETPQTGDASNIMLWLIMSIASALGLVAAVLYRRKKNAVR